MVTQQVPSGLSLVLFHICKTRFVGWMFPWLTNLLGNTFNVAPQSMWNLTGFSLISICAYISHSKTLLTVSVIAGFVVTQNRNSLLTGCVFFDFDLEYLFCFALRREVILFATCSAHMAPCSTIGFSFTMFSSTENTQLITRRQSVIVMFPVGMFSACLLWIMWFCFLCFLFSGLHFMDIVCGSLVVSPTSRFAYKSIRLHRGRFAYTTEVVSPTRSESIRLHWSRFAYT